MSSDDLSSQRSIERKERVLSSQLPAQISSDKQTIARPDGDCTATDEAQPKLQRSEVTVEMKGIRETALSCSESVVSTRIRTVYDRASSSSSRSDRDSVSSLDDADDSAFSPGHDNAQEFVVGGGRARGLSSDSYYISQTYQISSPSSPRAVSAVAGVGSPRFKSSRTISVGSEGNDNGRLQFVDRKEEELQETPQRPIKVGSQEKKVHFTGVEEMQEPDDSVSEKMKSARETVQQMIESSYMVSDITDVIGETQLGATEDSTSLLNTAEKAITDKPAPVTPQKNILNLDFPMAASTPERPLSPVLAYSPGAAIRSYAMEELAERKSRNNTPDRTTEESCQQPVAVTPPKKSMGFRFGPESGLDLADEGSSVDAFVSEMNVGTSSQPEVKITVQPAITDTALTSSYTISDPATSTEEEEAEALDKLVDLESIQAGYRFHDVGMMISAQDAEGGICNPAFDDCDSTDIPAGKSSEDKTTSKLPSHIATLSSPNASLSGNLEYSADAPNHAEQLSKPLSAAEDSLSVKETPLASQSVNVLTQPIIPEERKELASSPPYRQEKPASSNNANTPLAKVNHSPPVSVSRRFNIRDKKFEAALKSHGAVLKSESVSYDVYYDTPGYALTLADCWLRSQNGRWQLSANFTKLFNTDTQSQFVETEDQARIVSLLREVLGLEGNTASCAEDCSVGRFLHLSGLHEFVRYTTTRRVYSVSNRENGELTVELVLPEYGFWVGHVTSSVEGVTDGLCQALSALDVLWRNTGVSPLCLTGV